MFKNENDLQKQMIEKVDFMLNYINSYNRKESLQEIKKFEPVNISVVDLYTNLVESGNGMAFKDMVEVLDKLEKDGNVLKEEVEISEKNKKKIPSYFSTYNGRLLQLKGGYKSLEQQKLIKLHIERGEKILLLLLGGFSAISGVVEVLKNDALRSLAIAIILVGLGMWLIQLLSPKKSQ